jgi:SAM-dependent methyltransferase
VKRVLDAVGRYYSDKLAQHGPTAKGVDWNDAASQDLRFEQLLRVCDADEPFTLVDYGCGYGALPMFLTERGYRFGYTGYDISDHMVDEARRLLAGAEHCRFVTSDGDLDQADYAIASGIFNVRLEAGYEAWETHVLATIRRLDELSRRGFSFNMLTSYSDPERMRGDLYYADPSTVFDYCKRHVSRWVALLHDYGLWEFTMLVRKDVR